MCYYSTATHFCDPLRAYHTILNFHYLNSWSSTQKTIALSSGEAELTAVVKCSCECIGMVQLAEDWGLIIEADVLVDSTAALGDFVFDENGTKVKPY